MPTIAERALRRAMREKTFDRVYYFVGDVDFLKESTANELVAAAVDRDQRAFNAESLRGPELTAEALDTALNTPPLFTDRRAIVIKDVQALRKDARDALRRYVTNPASDTVLVLLAAAGEKPDAVLAQAASVLEFGPLGADRIPRWIMHHAATAIGVEISPSAAELLHRAVGDDLARLAGELDKLASYTGGATITDEAVTAVVGIQRGESMGDLLDAVAMRDAPRATELIPIVLAQPKTTAVSVIMALATQMLALAWGQAAQARGMRPGALERDYFNLLRESKVYPGRPWGEAVRSWVRAVPLWTPAALDQALRHLLIADANAKETRVTTDEQLVTAIVLALCALEQRAAA